LSHEPDRSELSFLLPAGSQEIVVLEVSQGLTFVLYYGPRRSSILSGSTSTQVKIGVSRAVYLLASLVLRSITRLRKSSGWSVWKPWRVSRESVIVQSMKSTSPLVPTRE